MLDLKKLQYLDAIYRHGSFTRASEELFVSQPAISTAISALEKELGLVLLTRAGKNIAFTPAGEQFMLHVKKILDYCTDAEKAVAEMSDIGNRTMRLGISPTVGAPLLHLMHSRFLTRWPDARIHLHEGSMRNNMEKLNGDIIDLSYNALPEPSERGNLVTIPVASCEICVLMHPDHPFVELERIPIERLAGEKLVMLENKARIHEVMIREFSMAGIVPDVVSTHEQIICMLNMIQLGNYLGFIDADSGYHAMGCDHLVIRPFENPVHFEVGFFWKEGKYLPRIALDLIDLAKKLLEKQATGETV